MPLRSVFGTHVVPDRRGSRPARDELREPAEDAQGWRVARELLRGPLRTLVSGQASGQAGDGFAQIAFAQLVLFEAGDGATPLELTKLLAVTLLPFSLVGPFAGVVIDRWDRRRTMVVVSILRTGLALAALGILTMRSQALAYAGIVALLSSSRFVLAAKGAALPRTVPSESLVTANAVSSSAGMVAAFFGAVAAATFVERWPAGGFLAAAGLYGAAATMFMRLPPVGGGITVALAAGLRRVASELADGARAVVQNAGIRRPLLAVWGHRFLSGAGFILLVLIADARHGFETSGYGLAIAVTGVAAFAGTAAAPVITRWFHPVGLLPVAFWMAAIASVVAGFNSALGVLVTAIGVAAFAFQVLKIVVDALVGRAAPDSVRGRVFAAYDVLYNVSFVLAALAFVPLWDLDRERSLLWALGIAFVGGGLLVARNNRTWPFGAPTTRARSGSRLRGRGVAMVLGAVPSLAFPEANLWWLAFVGFVPIVCLVVRSRSVREAAVRAWFGGAGYALAVHWWLVPNITVFAVPAAFIIGSLWILWALPAWWLLARPLSGARLLAALVVLPSAWVTGEFIRSWERLGGPFGLVGSSQWGTLPVLSLAALGGVWAVSFAVMAVNIALTAITLTRASVLLRLGALGAAVAFAAAGPVFAAVRAEPEVSRTLLVAGVQPGVIHPVEPRFAASEQATLSLPSGAFDLVVWGESSVGVDLEHRPSYLRRIARASEAVGTDVLVNVDARRGAGGILKASVLVGPDGIEARYDKMRLVPFGEYVPLRPLFGWLERVTRAPTEDRQRGEALELFATAGARLGPLICFESAFPDLTRRLVAMGADTIVVQSSTSTFQGSWGPEVHASLAAVRAVETGRPVLHATLTGVSAAFDARGRKLLWFGTDRRGTYQVALPLTEGTTPYVRWGDWVPALSVTILLGYCVVAGLRAARRPRSTVDPPQPGPRGQPVDAAQGRR